MTKKDVKEANKPITIDESIEDTTEDQVNVWICKNKVINKCILLFYIVKINILMMLIL